MYMPALTAVRCDPYAKAFYESLISRGKKNASDRRCHAQVPDRHLGVHERR